MADKVTFDPLNSLIILNDGVSACDAKEDIYSDWKVWVQGDGNAKYLHAFRTTGGDELSPGSYLGAYFFLTNGWRMRPYEGTHQLNVDGNLFVDGGGNPFVPTVGNYNVLVTLNVSSLSTSLVTEIPEIQYSSYSDHVTIDVTSTYSGTDYPVGTHLQPVNNMTDALLIANERGFDNFHIKGSITLTGLDLTGESFFGDSRPKTEIIVDASANVLQSEFSNCNIAGVFDGNVSVDNCVIKNATGFSGIISNTVLQGTIGASSSASAYPTHFLDCESGHGMTPEGIPVIDLVYATEVVFRNYSGGLILRNLINGDGKVKIDLNSGRVILEDNMTGGEVIVRGVGQLIDNSTGTDVNSDYLVSPESVSNRTWNETVTNIASAGTAGDVLNKIKKLVNLIPAGL